MVIFNKVFTLYLGLKAKINKQIIVCSTKIYLTTTDLTWQVKNMPAAGTISFLF